LYHCNTSTHEKALNALWLGAILVGGCGPTGGRVLGGC